MGRRKKKKKSAENVEDVDSGYFNGAESSSEPNSEEELNVLKSSNKACNKGKDYCKNEDNGHTEKEITNLLIKQIQNPTIDFQFGEVQEILDEINKEQVLTQSEFDYKVSKSLKNTSSDLLHVNKTDLLKDSETVEPENLESILAKPEHIK